MVTTLHVTMGMPGSGKSTWCASNAAPLNAEVVSGDMVRTSTVDAGQWFVRMHRRVGRLLAEGRNVVVDACCTTPEQRRPWLRLGQEHGAQCVLVVLDVAASAALERNAVRPLEVQVPHDRMMAYAKQFAESKITARSERWHDVIVVTAPVVAPVISPVGALTASRSW